MLGSKAILRPLLAISCEWQLRLRHDGPAKTELYRIDVKFLFALGSAWFDNILTKSSFKPLALRVSLILRDSFLLLER